MSFRSVIPSRRIVSGAVVFIVAWIVALIGVGAFAPTPANAYNRWRGSRWYGGHWYHGVHGGHLGWWWIASGSWYFFTRPAYPYPSLYVPPPVIVQPPVATVVQPARPPMIAPAPAPMPASPPMPTVPPGYTRGAYYYCGNPRGYYPYVPNCPGGWTPVPVNPEN